MIKSSVYLDHAAATHPYPAVLQEWETVQSDVWANPSSIHTLGQRARNCIDEARFVCALFFGVTPLEILFTSGATEGMHLAIVGSFLALKNPQKKVLVSPLAHQCIWSALELLQRICPEVEIQKIPITPQGYFDFELLTPSFMSQFDLVIADHGNSEIGILQDIPHLGALIQTLSPRPLLIVDIAASICSEVVQLQSLKADILVASAEKFGGKKGTGIVVKKDTVQLLPLIGGNQELGYRGGTENTEGIFCMAEALKLHDQLRAIYRSTWEELSQYLRSKLDQKKYTIITPQINVLPHIVHFLVREGTGQDLVIKADLQGICIASGPACSSGSVKPSQVLKNLGYSDEVAKMGVRISFGRDTKATDIDRLLEVL